VTQRSSTVRWTRHINDTD